MCVIVEWSFLRQAFVPTSYTWVGLVCIHRGRIATVYSSGQVYIFTGYGDVPSLLTLRLVLVTLLNCSHLPVTFIGYATLVVSTWTATTRTRAAPDIACRFPTTTDSCFPVSDTINF